MRKGGEAAEEEEGERGEKEGRAEREGLKGERTKNCYVHKQ